MDVIVLLHGSLSHGRSSHDAPVSLFHLFSVSMVETGGRSAWEKAFGQTRYSASTCP